MNKKQNVVLVNNVYDFTIIPGYGNYIKLISLSPENSKLEIDDKLKKLKILKFI